ncbi:interleukin-5 receptor subunit alpha-like [Pempheris klunzingeri]|uniref:interleukin-5 receptor subunit alpha-like n=1 Tax=Pempheris klunzingeri TaxID=3127111 RepID=UPI00397EE9A3
MKLFPVHSILWSSFLVLWASQRETEAYHPDVCQDEKPIHDLYVESSSVPGSYVQDDALHNLFPCHLYPSNLLNCSWSCDTLQKDIQLFIYISICDGESTVWSLGHWSEGKAASRSLILDKHQMLYVTLHYNLTRHDKWTVYGYTYDADMIEVPSPPTNISASIKDGGLLVKWALPHSQGDTNPSCFEYQLDIDDQLYNPRAQLSYVEPNADPHHTHRVRMRTRKIKTCVESPQWSDWSHTIMVEKSFDTLKVLVVISISLGIPMILLAVLLLVRHQRMVLFPPIPRPPSKYKYFLEKTDTFSLHLGPTAWPVEEITEVDDTEPNPVNLKAI